MEKNIITYESCQKALVKEIKATLRTFALLLPVFLVICVPVVIAGINMVSSGSGEMMILIIFDVIPFSLIPLILIYVILNEFLELRMIESYKFSIVKDTVLSTEKIYRRRRGQILRVYFVNYGKFELSSTQYDLTSKDDEYYLVILNANKKILNAYHTLTNECPDVEE